MTDNNAPQGVDAETLKPAPAAGTEEAKITGEKPDEAATTGDTAAPKDEKATEADETVKRQKALDRQFAKLRRATRELERENAALKAAGSQRPAVDANKPLKQEEFPDYDSYVAAKAAKAAEENIMQRIHAAQQQNEQSRRNAAVEAHNVRAEQAREKYEDFDEVALGDHWNPTPAMVEAIVESEMGNDVAYYLGKNPSEAERIAALSPTRQIAELGRIEAKLTANPPKKITAAPEPPKIVKAASTPQGGLSDNLPMEEWVKRRNAELKRKRA